MAEGITITIDLETATIINRCFLPTNPNKLRNKNWDPSQLQNVRKACFDFRGKVEEAERRVTAAFMKGGG